MGIGEWFDVQRARFDRLVPPADPSSVRLIGLDVARGIAVAKMVFGEQLRGSGFPSLRHAQWVGLTWADITFPAFLFLAGSSLALVMQRVGSTSAVTAMFVRRAINFTLLGLVFNAFSGDGADLSTLRIPGVLQRSGLCALVALMVVLACRRRAGLVAAAALVLLVGYGQWMVHSDRGCGAEVTAACNAAGSVDADLIPIEHLYRGVDYPGYDPEGIASSTTAVVTVLVGWVAMTAALRRVPSVRWWLVALPSAGVLWMASWWSPITAGIGPIKRIWSPSFTLRTAAIALVLLALCRPLDGLTGRARQIGYSLTFPFAALGRHALVIYVGQHLVGTALDRTTRDGVPLSEHVARRFSGWGDQGRYAALAVFLVAVAVAMSVLLDALDRAAARRPPRQPG